MNLGEKLKSLRKYYGYTQTDLEKRLDIPQKNISNYESTSEPFGMLEYILKFCALINIPVAEFFMENIEDLKRELPDYITPSDAAILKILNTSVDIKIRIHVKQAYANIIKAILVQYEDKLGHLPEFRALFGDGMTYDQPEESVISSIHDEEKKD